YSHPWRMAALLVSFKSHAYHRALSSFPTRRSSDLNRFYYSSPGMAYYDPWFDPWYGYSGFGLGWNSGWGWSLGFNWGSPWYGYGDRKSTRLNSSHVKISYAVFCLKKKTMRCGY